MVEFVTPRATPSARGAGQVSSAGSAGLIRAGQAAKTAADTFTAFYEEEARIENDLLFATAQADWSQKFDETKKGAGAGYAKGMLEQYDTYVTEVMAKSPERGKKDLQLGFDKYRLSLQEKAMAAEAAARAAAKARAIAEANRQRGLMIARSDEPLLAFDEIVAANPGMDQKQQDALLKVAFDSLLTIGSEGALEAAQQVIDGGRGDKLSGSEYISMERAIKSGRSRLETQEAAKIRVAADLFDDWAQDRAAHAAETGRVPTDDELSAAIDQIGLPEDQALELKSGAQREFQKASVVHDVAMMPADDLSETLSAAEAAADKPEGAAEAIEYRNNLLAATAQRQQSLSQDGAAYLMRNDKELSALLNRAGEAEGGAGPVLYSRAKSYMDGLYDQLGVPAQNRTYLPVAQAQAMAADLESNVSGEAGLVGRQIRETYGDMTPSVMSQLRRAGVSELTMEKIRHAGEHRATKLLDAVTGMKPSDFDLPDGISRDDISSSVSQTFNAYYRAVVAGGGQPAADIMNAKQGILETVTTMLVKTEGRTPDEAALYAFSNLYPEEVVDNGRVLAVLPVGVPPGVATVAKAELENIEDTGFFFDTGAPDYVDKAVSAAALRSNGVWINNATGDGLVLGMLGDDGYSIDFIVNERGERIERKFSELVAAPRAREKPSNPWGN